MKDNFFIDTNIFIYSFSSKDLHKKNRSQEIIQKALETNQGYISTQVIQEFINVATKKFETPIKYKDLELYLHDVLFPLCTINTNFDLIEKSLQIHHKNKLSYYDSMIIAAALFSGASILITEDLNDKQKIEGLTILNPFKL
ncbi:MAG: PIN domain-containing protein [Leptospirales bacterium]